VGSCLIKHIHNCIFVFINAVTSLANHISFVGMFYLRKTKEIPCKDTAPISLCLVVHSQHSPVYL
jgi:hypothetical protein